MAFVINNNQIAVFDSIAFEKFYKRVIPIFESCFTEKVRQMSYDELLNFVRTFHQKAKQNRIQTERGTVRFICLAFILNKEFYKRTEFSQILNYDDIDMDECMDLIFDDADRIANKQKPISSSLTASNKNFKIVPLIEKIAKSIQ
jgi:hypothetical protein